MTVGILLVGGFGTRLKPLTNESPKPMLPVAGLPVTEHQIMAAKRAGIHTLVLATILFTISAAPAPLIGSEPVNPLNAPVTA